MSIIDKIEASKRQYTDTGESTLSDDEYDTLVEYVKDELGITIEQHTPAPDGTAWKLAEHRAFMPSMPMCPKTLSELEQLVDKHGGKIGFASVKYDGMSIELQYTDGHLTGAVLRGDGTKGEDVFDNAKKMGCTPLMCDAPGEFSAFGEVVISYNNLMAANELREADGKRPYKSPRSAVAMLRSRSINPRLLPLLRVRIFDIYPRLYSKQSRNIDYIRGLNAVMRGGPTLKFDPVDVHVLPAKSAWNSMIATGRRRDEFQYQMDGFVFRCADGQCIKLKFESQSAVTKVIRVVEQLGNTGVVSPVVEFEPVTLVGADVRRASAHNSTLIASKLDGLGVGATVMISRRGDVIPHVEAVIKPAEVPWVPTDECPSCGSAVVQDDCGTTRRCSADAGSCPGTTVGLIIEFCRRIGVDGFGPGVVAALIEDKLVGVPSDLYYLDPELVADAVQPGGGRIGETTAKKLVLAIGRKGEMSWGELLGAICIPGCATSTMTTIAAAYPDPEDLLSANVEDLMKLDGIGPGKAASIATYIATRWYDVIDPLLLVVSLTRTTGPLIGMTFCITLSLHSCGRTEMESNIRAAGGTVKSSVSSKVTHLVCNFPDEGTSKLKRAKALGIPIISEDALIKMMGVEVIEKEIDPNDEF